MEKWLLVEDEVDIRNVVKFMFLAWQKEAIEFSNGNDAFDYLDRLDDGEEEDNIPEFALMDIRMPGPNGNEIANRIRQSPVIRHIPIMLMTAFQLNDEQKKNFHDKDGVDHIVFKPLPDFDKFRTTIEGVIAERKAKNESA